MRILLLFLFAISLSSLYQCASAPELEKAAFITLLGNDTLAVEQFTIQDQSLEAAVLVRTPSTSYQKYKLNWDEEDQLQEYWSVEYAANGEDILNEETLSVEGDSLVYTRKMSRDTTVRKIANQKDVLPFVDMLHWPYELATRHMSSRQLDGLDQPLFTGRNISKFEIRKISPDSVSIKHPSRGMMYAEVGPSGELLSLDAGATTRKMKVSRVDGVDLMAMKDRFMAADAAGKGFGALSGQTEESFTAQGANFNISYGSPARRGRELFGGIVPWNELWRTGANRATHFSTDKDLQMGELAIPAGEYTLFTIPAPDGGTLIINTETGQNGRSHKADRDLGRVQMTRTREEESVEQFTIKVEESPEGGVLQLIWGNDRFEVPFVVLNGTR